MTMTSDVFNSADENISTESTVLETFVLCIIFAVSVIGNVSLWIVVLRSRALRTVTNMFILGLSAADLLVATVNMPLTVFTIIKGYWMLSNTACVAMGFINMLTLVTSVMSLCNISVNRFFMVCRPGKFKNIYSTRNAILMIIATVTCSILLSSPPLLGWSEYVYTPTHSFCFADWVNYQSYAYFMIGCCFGIPFGVMTFCNISIIRSVRESRRKVKSTYRATVSSTVNSLYEAEQKDDNKEYDMTDMTDIENSKLSLPTVNTSTEGNNKNAQSIDKIKRDNSHVDMQLDIPKHDNRNDYHNKTDKSAKQHQNQDGLSDDSSNESNSALISQVGRQSPRRNPLFGDGNQTKGKLKTLFRPGTPQIEPNQNNIDKNLLHPQWERKPVSGKPSGTRESSTENRNTSSTDKAAPVSLRSPSKFRRREEIRLAFSLIIVVVLFVICWLPYCISMLLSIYIPESVPREFHMFTLLIGYANSGCNPIVYGLMNQRFKVGFKRLFCFWKSHVFNLSSSHSK